MQAPPASALPLPPAAWLAEMREVASAAISPFDSLSDEMFLKIITMAKGDNHDFLLDELCNVSVRFRQIATDSSLWRDFVSIKVRLPRKDHFPTYFSKVEFMVRKCINDRTTRLQITGIGCASTLFCGCAPHCSNKPDFWSSLFPSCNDPLIDALIYVAANFPRLNRVDLKRMGIQINSDYDIPAPWKLTEPTRCVSLNSPWKISLVRWPSPPPPSPVESDK